MRQIHLVLVFLLVSLLVTTGALPIDLQPNPNSEFRAQLRGTFEVPPRDTPANGVALFQLSADGKQLNFRLGVSSIDNVVSAHLHWGKPGERGPVVASLFGPVAPGGGTKTGLVSKNIIKPINLVGPMKGRSLDTLITEMRAGNTYVNIHTDDGVEPTDTGPGDFPGGEIRGQLALSEPVPGTETQPTLPPGQPGGQPALPPGSPALPPGLDLGNKLLPVNP